MPATTPQGTWLKYTEGKRPLIYVDSYSQYVQCAYLYLEAAAQIADNKDGAQRIRTELLPLLRLRHYASDGSRRHDLVRSHSWQLHCADPVVKLGTVATFFPVGRTAYLLRGNRHTAGALCQYMMTKLNWRVFAFTTEVPNERAVQAEALAVPVHSWFKPRP